MWGTSLCFPITPYAAWVRAQGTRKTTPCFRLPAYFTRYDLRIQYQKLNNTVTQQVRKNGVKLLGLSSLSGPLPLNKLIYLLPFLLK